MSVKQKSNSGAAKRFKKTGSGKFKRRGANRSHILTKRSRKNKRQLRSPGRYVCKSDQAAVESLLV